MHKRNVTAKKRRNEILSWHFYYISQRVNPSVRLHFSYNCNVVTTYRSAIWGCSSFFSSSPLLFILVLQLACVCRLNVCSIFFLRIDFTTNIWIKAIPATVVIVWIVALFELMIDIFSNFPLSFSSFSSRCRSLSCSSFPKMKK